MCRRVLPGCMKRPWLGRGMIYGSIMLKGRHKLWQAGKYSSPVQEFCIKMVCIFFRIAMRFDMKLLLKIYMILMKAIM